MDERKDGLYKDPTIPEQREKERTINKLILVGNGFDLAMGFKTSYNHFLGKYFKDALEGLQKSEIENNNGKEYLKYTRKFTDENIFFTLSIIDNRRYFNCEITDFKNVKEFREFLRDWKIKFQPESGLFREIFDQEISTWVDLEGIYFKLLKLYLSNSNQKVILLLNKEIEKLTIELEKFLSKLEYGRRNSQELGFTNQLYAEVKNEEIYPVDEHSIIKTEVIYMLNFNYTTFFEDVIRNNPRGSKASRVIKNIHGKLNSVEEPIILGYGDEMDKEYKVIEEKDNNEYLKHIKSFSYLKNDIYKDLIRFIEFQPFQVVIYGHSCGLSDRVLLNEIFEHENCVSIKPYFYEDKDGNNDYTNKVMDISRHFTSNQLMRKKVVGLNPDNRIPQIER